MMGEKVEARDEKKVSEKVEAHNEKKVKTEMRDEKAEARAEKKAKAEKKKWQIAGLIIALVVVLGGGVLFVGAVSGWFNETKVTLSEEYYCKEDNACEKCEKDDECEKCEECGELTALSVSEYEELVKEKKSFVVVIDQVGCTTAERIKGFAKDFMKENEVKFYKMEFAEMKETEMHEKVKYYPSVVIVNKGKVAAFLKADSDEDSGMYNQYDEFETWMKKWLVLR